MTCPGFYFGIHSDFILEVFQKISLLMTLLLLSFLTIIINSHLKEQLSLGLSVRLFILRSEISPVLTLEAGVLLDSSTGLFKL